MPDCSRVRQSSVMMSPSRQRRRERARRSSSSAAGAFALDHIPVIKKPLAARGDSRSSCVSAVERVPAAAQLAVLSCQAQRGLGAGLRTGAFEKPRAGYGVIGEPFIIYIGCKVHTVHDILP